MKPFPRRRLYAALVIALAGCRQENTPQAGIARLESAFPDAGDVPSIRLAIAAARTNDMGVGVVALQGAKQAPGLTAEQLAAVEQAAQILTGELVRRATAGDARARADLELIERSRSQ